ncbi:GGDEF domain-containing protein [Krasilnikovia sp. MM14-A1004]|uniref:GGDEF domain-containing protein n=1 Tax=Krasilnikovia sp. MM14-A1004 TaxID=3373541 RepID=UPI00399CC170
MGDRGWKAYAVAAALAVAAYQVIPDNPWWDALWQVGIGYAAVAAIVVGTRRLPGRRRLPWWCIAAGLGANTSGIAVAVYASDVLHIDWSPTPADPLFLLLYPGCALGFALLIRAREPRRNWAAMVDATTFTTGLGLLAWVYVIEPTAHSDDMTVLGRAIQIAYPVGDLLLLAMLTRLVRSGGARGAAFWWITASGGAFFAGDTIWVVLGNLDIDISGSLPLSRAVAMVFLVAFSLFGVAALHPSAAELDQPAVRTAPRLSGAMLATLTVTSLVAPALLALQVSTGRVTDGPAIVVGCTALFLLVVTRMAQLLREVERQAECVRALSRQDELTKLPNRRAWNDEAPRALEQARRRGTQISVAVIDLDHFKRYNDTYGHPAGDRLLADAAAAWLSALRRVDLLARVGGEEFVVLLPESGADEAGHVLARALAVTPDGQTFSAGLAVWDGVETSDELTARADAALYAAKSGGRNRIVVARDPAQPPVVPAEAA